MRRATSAAAIQTWRETRGEVAEAAFTPPRALQLQTNMVETIAAEKASLAGKLYAERAALELEREAFRTAERRAAEQRREHERQMARTRMEAAEALQVQRQAHRDGAVERMYRLAAKRMSMGGLREAWAAWHVHLDRMLALDQVRRHAEWVRVAVLYQNKARAIRCWKHWWEVELQRRHREETAYACMPLHSHSGNLSRHVDVYPPNHEVS